MGVKRAGIEDVKDWAKSNGLRAGRIIDDMFKAIGEQGRAALKRMRELLGVLRETGFSDDAHAGSASELQLRPAAPLEEQLQRASR